VVYNGRQVLPNYLLLRLEGSQGDAKIMVNNPDNRCFDSTAARIANNSVRKVDLENAPGTKFLWSPALCGYSGAEQKSRGILNAVLHANEEGDSLLAVDNTMVVTQS
jgi:hypothetical protein